MPSIIQNYVIRFVRTYVMLGVGAVVTWLGVHFHVVLSPHTQDALAVLATAVVAAIYYALVTVLEHFFPKAGVLLGVPAKPNYAQIGKDGVAVITDLEGDFTNHDPLAIEGADPNTPGSSTPAAPPQA